MNAQHSFALFYLTTLVIYAEDKTKVKQSMAAILKAADEHKWEVTIPPARDWAPEFQMLRLDSEFWCTRPA
jgi:hypothetical protein